MLGLDDMRCFVEVIDAGGLNRAAERIGLSKSIVSRRLSAMEADLGVRLVTRTTRGVIPTEAGLELLDRCRRLLEDVAEMREAVGCKGGDMVGRLRITAPLGFGIAMSRPFWPGWRESIPGWRSTPLSATGWSI